MGFEDATLLDTSGSPISRVGETIHGGGGYFGERGHIEELSGGTPSRTGAFRMSGMATASRSSTT